MTAMADDNSTPTVTQPMKTTGGFQISQEPVTGDGPEGDPHKYDIAAEPTEPAERPAYEDLGELPSSYQEDLLFLAARDPRWLYSYWDFDWSRYSADTMLGGLAQFFLRTSTAEGDDEAVFEIQPAARNWYVPVARPATTYLADIGFFERDGAWHSIVRSGSATTPPDSEAREESAAFATVPAHLSYEHLLEMVRAKIDDGESLLAALARIAGEGRIEFRPGAAPTWTEQQKRPLAAMLAPGPSSLFSGIGASWSAQPFSGQRERGFFLHVNAEIVFYGGTDPDATVWIDGREIRLSPDGTFRYHFTLPDGDFAIPIIARSPDGVEERTATLSFVRGTTRTGEVGATSQPPELSPLIGKK